MLCRPVENLKPGHGCDGVDNNCNHGNAKQPFTGNNQAIDECGEDAYPPQISFSSVAEFCGGDKHVFRSADQARQCVKNHVLAVDDCETVTTEVEITVASSSNTLSLCGTMYQVDVTAAEDICGKSTPGTFFVLVDDNIPDYQGVCEFSQGPDDTPSLDTSMASKLCGEKIFFSSIAEAKECVLLNSKASDDCRAVDLNINAVENVTGTGDALSVCTSTFEISVRLKRCIYDCALCADKFLSFHIAHLFSHR